VALRLGQIVDSLGGRLVGDATLEIQRLSPLDTAQADALSFLNNPQYQSQLASTQAACVIVSPAFEAQAAARGACIVADNPYHYFAKLTQFWRQHQRSDDAPRIHPSAVIHPEAHIDASARIGPLCVVERGAKVGANTWLKSHVTLGENCSVGERCIVHAGVVIGADGFGFAPQANKSWLKIPQVGGVRIGDDVEIGANTTIDRGTLDDTWIGNGVKLDNQIQIAHNVRIGDHTAIAACVGIAGSATIGAFCQIGGAAGILGHLQIANDTVIGPMSLVMSSITNAGKYVGIYPLQSQSDWEKSAAVVRRLPELRRQILRKV